MSRWILGDLAVFITHCFGDNIHALPVERFERPGKVHNIERIPDANPEVQYFEVEPIHVALCVGVHFEKEIVCLTIVDVHRV